MTITHFGKISTLLGSAGTAAMLLAAGAAHAQSASAVQAAPAQVAGAGELAEVVVTAQKRSENLQNVPIAVTAFTARMLQDRGITDVHAMASLTPNVNLDEGSPFSGSTSVLSASIRGIGQDDFAFNLDPGVGVYVDGVYLARTVGANQNLMDVERVEILKGPQGTLFGRNTIGGAISVVTHTPGSEYTGSVQATTGSYSRRDIAGTFDIPISDNLRTSITVSSLQRDGYQKRIAFPAPYPYVTDPVGALHSAGNSSDGNTQGGQNQQVVRFKALWTPRNDLKITLTADETHEDQTTTPNTVLKTVTTGPNAAFGAFYNLCVLGIPFVPTAAAVCGPRGPGINAAGVTTANVGLFNTIGTRLLYNDATAMTGNIDTTYANGNNYSRLDSYGGAVTADWELNSDLDLKSITSYRGIQWKVGIDLDGSVLDMLEPSFIEKQHQTSQELQLIGTALDSKLHYVAGLYFFNEGGLIHDFVTFPAGLLQIDGLNVLNTTSYAAFGHVDYKLTEQIGLTLGARYSIEDKVFEGEQTDQNAFSYKISGCYPVTAACQVALGFPVASNPLRYFPAGRNKQEFYNFSPTFGAQYHVTRDLMAYVSFSSGFKSGGWTTRLSNPIPDATLAQFGPEIAKTAEVGIKSEWFDRRLILNAAGFYTEYDGIQLNVQQGISPTTKNAGDAVIPGAEVEAQAILGHGFSFSGTLGYMDAHYTKTLIGTLSPTQALPLSTKLPKTPDFKLSLSPQYEYMLPNEAKLRFLADYTHTGVIYNDIANTPELRRPQTDILNLSVQYISPNDRYQLILGGTNVTDQRYLTTGQDQSAGGNINGTYNPPAEWYLTLRVKL